MPVLASTVEVVVARYREDLGWTRRLPVHWALTVYDKSAGGPPEPVAARGYRSPDRSRPAEAWPGARALPNVGAEAHTYLTHIVDRYEHLAGLTVFTQGDPLFHHPNFVNRLSDIVEAGYEAKSLGPVLHCDADGWPQHARGTLPQLREMAALFGEVPERFSFKPGAFVVASDDRVRRHSRDTWRAALGACRTRLHACAMERLWSRLFGEVLP